MLLPKAKTNPRWPDRAVTRPGTRPAFTLIELLVVIIVLAILIGLLLPVINAALNTAKEAAVQAEVNSIAQALASFKSQYGDYPPSRVLLAENGFYPVNDGTSLGVGDITLGALAQRSLISMRKFFPRVIFSTTGIPPQILNNANYWYDFNGNGIKPASSGGTDANHYILEGHECLVFFLGGIPNQDPNSGAFGLNGFGKDPSNPFTNNLASDPNYAGAQNPMYSNNRQAPFYEFNAGRLYADPNNLSNAGINPGIPGYYDSLGAGPPSLGSGSVNFLVYFSGYGNGIYDPNDVNFAGPVLNELDGNSVGPIGLQYKYGGATFTSPAPNPYTTTKTVTTTGTVTFEKPQSFQLFSAGRDGLYGVGGQFIAPSSGSSSASDALPLDLNNTFSGATVTGDGSIRIRERDNLTNFQSGKLQ
jgi:prepilin-type N-terminal cleavage/methylation domain-containing protein